MRVSFEPIGIAGSCRYLIESWREATPYLNSIFHSVRKNKAIKLKSCPAHLLKRILVHNIEIVKEQVTLKYNMVESA